MNHPERLPFVRDGVIKVPLTRGLVAVADVASADVVMSRQWFADKGSAGFFYARAVVAGKQTYLHRLLLSAPLGMCVDHINGDTLDNRLSNIRLVTSAQNNINRAVGSNNKSGTKGVSWVASRKRWLANIGLGGRTKTIGWFKSKDEAVAARLFAERKIHGEFARAIL